MPTVVEPRLLIVGLGPTATTDVLLSYLDAARRTDTAARIVVAHRRDVAPPDPCGARWLALPVRTLTPRIAVEQRGDHLGAAARLVLANLRSRQVAHAAGRAPVLGRLAAAADVVAAADPASVRAVCRLRRRTRAMLVTGEQAMVYALTRCAR